MVEDDVNLYPILLLVNFWEIRPSQMGSRLDDLLRRGVTQFASFVPWQMVEADISHALPRFLQAVSDRKMKIFLILSPEVGIHYLNSGLPKDVIARKENVAQDCQLGKIPVHLPPNSFHLPSLFSPEFNKRYNSFLGRMDGIFNDFNKTQPHILECVTAVLSGSFWKYYRSPRFSSQSIFGGNAGDYSPHAALSYRQRIESFYSQKEFADPTPSAANRWKTRSLEEMNRRWFYQQSEDVFRSRSRSMVRKRCTRLQVAELEIYTPEADPAVAYSNFLQMVSGGHADFPRLSSLIEEAALRNSLSASSPACPFVHWTSMGGFRMLADAEKQFLILKSLLLVGGQRGGILIDEAEWFSFSQQFRSRLDTLARSLMSGEYTLRTQVLYLTPHLWSNSGPLLDEVVRRVGTGVKLVSTLDLVLRESFSQLLIVDASYILTREMIQKLTAWAKAGRVVVIPRSPLFTESGRLELEQALLRTQRIEVDLGIPYHLHSVGDGKVIVYDTPDSFSLAYSSSSSGVANSMRDVPLSSLQTFLTSILSIAEVENYCHLGDNRLSVIPFEKKREGGAVFVLNGTRRSVTADIIFPNEVQIGDLGAVLSGNAPVPLEDLTDEEIEELGARANRFSLEVPPYGVLPISVNGVNLTERKERQMAALTAEATRENAASAAISELPGFSSDEGLEDLWN